MANNEQRQDWPEEKSKTAGETPVSMGDYRAHKIGIAVLEAVEATVREVARENLRDEKDDHLYDVHHLRKKITHLSDPANWEAVVGEDEIPVSQLPWQDFNIRYVGTPAPPEGSDGEVERRSEGIVRGARYESGLATVLATDLHWMHDQIQRLQREKLAEVGRASDKLQEVSQENDRLQAEIAHLSDPENWEVEWEDRPSFPKATVRYVGPPEREGESDEAND